MEERSPELVGEVVPRHLSDRRKLVLEPRTHADLRGQNRVRRGVFVQEGERADLTLEARRQPPHGPNPGVLKRMGLGREENVEAQDRLPQRRTEQNAAIVPSSLVECHRFDAGLLKHFGKPQSM